MPPTTGTLVPHTRRASYLALVLKKSTMPGLKIPLATDFSWIEKEGQLHSEQCTVPPAPEAQNKSVKIKHGFKDNFIFFSKHCN